MADTGTGRRQPGADGSTLGLFGGTSGPYGATTRLLSASHGPATSSSAHRARPTTPELIAEAYGRRLHGLDLLSTRKLTALNATAAKLEAQVASRAAAINLRTSTAATGPSAAAALAAAVVPATAAPGPTNNTGARASSAHTNGSRSTPRGTGTGAAGGGGGGADGCGSRSWGGATGGGGAPVPDPQMPPATGAPAARSGGLLGNIAERGASIARLLAMQDRVLHGALQAQAQAHANTQAQAQVQAKAQAQAPLVSSAVSSPVVAAVGASRFLSSGWDAGFSGGGGFGGGEGVVTTEELRRLEQLSVRHDSQVATATVNLFRLSPRSSPEPPEASPATPPNTERSNPLLPLPLPLPLQPLGSEAGVGPEDSGSFLPGTAPGSPSRQLARSKEFQTMARFVQSLQRGDDESLIQQARSVALYGSLPPDGMDLARASTAPLPTLPSSCLPLSPSGHAAAGGALGGGGGGSEPSVPRLRIVVPGAEGGEGGGEDGEDGGGNGDDDGGGAVLGASSSGRMLTLQGEKTPGRGPQLDLSAISTGQPRSRDILDGLIRAVEMFVGADLGGEQRSPGGTAAAATAETGGRAESPFAAYAAAVARAAAADGGPQGAETPFSGVYGSPELLSDRVRKKGALAVLSNPAGFRAEVAAGEVAMYREMADRCRAALAQAAKYPQDSIVAADLLKQVATLHHCRPYFVAPRQTLPEVVLPLRPPSSRGMSRQTTTFLVQSVSADSVFLQRAVDSEGEDIIDPPTIRERQVRKDWNRVVRKDTFRSLVGCDDPGVTSGTTGLGHSLDALLAVIIRHKDTLRAAYTYYSTMGISISDYCFAVNLNSWRTFIFDCGVSSAGPPATAAAAVTTPPGLRGGGPQPSLQPLLQPGPASAPAAFTAAAAGSGAWAGRPQAPRGVSAHRQSMAGLSTAASASATAGASDRTRVHSATTGAGAFGAGRGSDRQLLTSAATAGQHQQQQQPGPVAGQHPPAHHGGAGGPHHHPGQHQPADAIFQAVHAGAEKRVLEGKVNTDRTLLRFEWYEALIRLATQRHIKGGVKCGSIAAALEHLWVYDVLPALPHAAVHEPNKWRVSRLFGDPGVNQLFILHMDVLMALYDCLTCARQPRIMHLADWIGLLNSFGLIGDVTGLTLHAAKLSYTRSLCVVVDEMGRWSQAVCADPCDFLEALARLAEEMAPPPVEEVAEALRDVGLYGRELKAAMAHPWLMYYTSVPPDVLRARREAAAAAAAARSPSTSTGEDVVVPPLPHTPVSPAALASVTAAAAGRPLRPGTRGGSVTLLPPVNTPTGAARPTSPTQAAEPGAAAAAAAMPPPPSAQPSSTSTCYSSSSSAPPPLSFQLGALMDLLLGRLREMWGVADDRQLAERLKAAAAAGQQTMRPLPPPPVAAPGAASG